MDKAALSVCPPRRLTGQFCLNWRTDDSDMTFKIDFFGPARPIRLRFRLRRSGGLVLHTTITAKSVWHAKHVLMQRYGSQLDSETIEVMDG